VLTGGASFGLVIVAQNALVLAGVGDGAADGFPSARRGGSGRIAEGLGMIMARMMRKIPSAAIRTTAGRNEVSGIREKAAQSYLLSVTYCNIRTKRPVCGKVDYSKGFCWDLHTW